MNKIISLLTIVSVIAISSCKDDDEPGYSFKDQEASGKIANANWTYADGYASIDGSGSDASISVTLTLAQDGATGCDIGFPEGDEVFFTLPNATGLYTLSFTSADSHTATLFDTEEFFNYIAATGAIEITTISESEITGRIDARVDGQNFVNGNFTVSICQ